MELKKAELGAFFDFFFPSFSSKELLLETQGFAFTIRFEAGIISPQDPSGKLLFLKRGRDRLGVNPSKMKTIGF
ncbi:hypothetical protein JWG45_18730 [Leptospira sp. 201903070]|uniref:Uncharacterized protein n=1 Tax=Leptospira ainlahdjerensis TaxID=2810033 RepID=A0ABS2UFR5_9LEPT|nr:hypothetical protein [Leptospira ainlahdjerensis]MBM9579183.1 hypothetical protein [Leptospira ainlahdjerensis]